MSSLPEVAVDRSQADDDAIVCLLVVNRIPRLPTAAVMSILHRSPARIVVGYVEPKDIENVPHHERVEFVDLSAHVAEVRRADISGEYREYGSEASSTSLALKWRLLEHCLTQNNPEVVIYCDVDIVWLEDVAHDITAAFRTTPATHLLLQSQQVNAAVQLPCTGFMALRGSDRALAIVRECSRRNDQALLVAAPGEFVNDEDIMARYLVDAAPGEIQNLPQTAYPVGSLASLYRRDPLVPDLEPQRPLLFHANFVIGVDAKIKLLRRVLQELDRLDPYLGLADD